MTPSNMKGERIFITGGAGFIGSRLVRALAAQGAEITIFDNLLPQVHGPSPAIDLPAHLIVGDVCDAAGLAHALGECRPTIVVHLAAETGTGQSADEPVRYVDVNVGGTARLIEALKGLKNAPSRVVLAATRAVYGEGAYKDNMGQLIVPPPRQASVMVKGIFDLHDIDGHPLTPTTSPEHLPPAPGSVYGTSKLMQEYLLQQVPAPWGTAILRLQNVYGPGQSLRNPYTGVLSIFCQQALTGQTLNIFEDGHIHRDFVFVDDVVTAFVAACYEPNALGRIINIGTGERTSILDAARLILENLGFPTNRLQVSGDFRAGDIRHAVADISLAKSVLRWRPATTFSDGIAQLTEWSKRENT
jgi:dTDP-L-rhamnose 4-epimerase